MLIGACDPMFFMEYTTSGPVDTVATQPRAPSPGLIGAPSVSDTRMGARAPGARPANAPASTSAVTVIYTPSDLPRNWWEAIDNKSGHRYYFNGFTNAASWIKPTSEFQGAFPVAEAEAAAAAHAQPVAA